MSLSLPHRHELEELSRISPGIIAERGYFTATTSEQIESLGLFSREQCQLVPSLVIPIHSPSTDGPVGYQLKPDAPRLNEKGKPVKYETPAGWSMRFDVSPNPAIRALLLDPKVDLFITEGIKKGDCAATLGLCTISLLGVWNWRGKNDLGGLVALGDWEDVAIKGRRIYIVFDNDVMFKPEVQEAMRRLSGFLLSRGAAQVLCIVPALIGREGKLGLDDFFYHGGTRHQLMQCVNHELLAKPKLRKIKVNNRPMAEITEDAVKALEEWNEKEPQVFIRSDELVRVVTDYRTSPKIKGIDFYRMRGILSRLPVQWVRTVKTKEGYEDTDTPPPSETVYDLITLDAWPNIPHLINITRAPVLSPSGKLNMSRGYCRESQVYVDCEGEWPEFPGTARDAVHYIFSEIFAEFPFVSTADRAHALALMLLQIVRPYIMGPTPLHLFDAPAAGTGKSLCAKACLMPTAGIDIGSTPGGKDDEGEWRKYITAALLDGHTFLFYDNIEHKVDSTSLENALTSPEWLDRKLQVSEIVKAPIRCLWVMTTNNAELGKAIARRTLYIHLDARCENPQDRKIKKPHLERWIHDNRLMIVSALCTIVQSWIDADKPLYTARHWGSYEEYATVIGGILEHVGVTGFLDNVEELRERGNAEHSSWVAFVKRWWDSFGDAPVTAGEIVGIFKEDESLSVWLGDKESGHAGRLGRQLKKRADNVFGGIQMKIWNGARTSSIRYHLIPIQTGIGLELPENGPIPTENGPIPTQSLLAENGLFEPDGSGESRDSRENRDFSHVRATHALRAQDHAGAEPENPTIPIFEPESGISNPIWGQKPSPEPEIPTGPDEPEIIDEVEI